ncbi:MAG: Trk family potassium uptake protein [SAR202 cluster bacterium]|nr:Trk family potassium uptake protein [SAR202 cluster bacterium]
MNEPPNIERGQNPEGQTRVARTAPIHRPLSRVIQTGMTIATPPKALGIGGVVLGFLLLIGIGTALLSLPVARQPGTEWNGLTALFTATSAVCVTGLTVENTGAYWSGFGQGVIFALMQAGGLGVMTASLLILVILGRSISLRDRFLVREVSGIARIRSVAGLVLIIIVSTAILEVLGGIAIWYQLYANYDLPNPIWKAAFHTISSFNNAGFDIFGDSLAGFSHDPVFLFTTAVLVVSGGLGMLLLLDVLSKRRWHGLTLNTRLILSTTAGLLILGFLAILLFEYTNPNTLGPMSVKDKIANAAFHSVTTRSAGLNTITVADTNEETEFIKIALMFVGGATGSTAGGIKVGTFAVLVLATIAAIRGFEHAQVFGRRIPHRVVYRAGAVAGLYALFIFTAAFVLIITETENFRDILFETMSAIATVGLSTGITPDLSVAGKITLVIAMFIGRLGPLTLAYTLGQRSKEPLYEQPEAEVAIG